MKRHKNLERAIVLSLMLSTGIYETAFAEDYESNGVQSSNVNITGDNAIVNGTISYNGKVDIGSSDNLETGKLTIDATSNGMEVAYMERPKLEIFANDVIITAGQNGIVTLPSDSISGAIIIGSEDRKINSLSITAKGQGIDNKTGEVKIYGTENSEIKIHSTNEEGEHVELKSAVNNTKYEGKENSSGIVEINGGEITLSADNGNGIITNAEKTSITSKGTTEINVSNAGIESIKGLTEIKGKDAVINANQYGIRADGTSTDDDFENSSSVVNLNSTKDNIINVKGLYDSNGKLQDNSGDGINVTKYSTTNNSEQTQKEGNLIDLTAGNNNAINVVDDGIYIDVDSDKTVSLTAGNNNEIIAGNNGIDHRGSETITLSATGANVIKAGVSSVLENTVGNGDGNKDGYRDDKNGDGIRTQGNGNVKVEAETYNDIAVRDTGLYIHGDSTNSKIDLIANGTNDSFGNIIYAQENGVQIDGNDEKNKDNAINVIANKGGNSIIAKKNAVYNNGSGTIKISAKNPDNPYIGVSILANYNDYNNELTAEENGVKSDGTGSTIVEADNNNIIAGTVNGILSNAKGTIDVTAGNNNVIGQYTDEEEKQHTSQIGINVSSGTVTITSGNGNNIYGTQKGILAKNETDVKVISTNGNTVINVVSDAVTGKNADVVGIDAEKGASVSLTSKNNFITATTGKEEGYTATSVLANGGTVNITATAENGINQLVSNNNTTLDVNEGKVYLTANMKNGQNIIYNKNKSIGIEVSGQNSLLELKAASNKVESASTDAIYLSGKAEAKFLGNYNSVLANAENSTAVRATDGSNITLDAKTDITSDLGINIVSGGKYGIWNIGGSSLTLMSKTLNYVNGGNTGIYIYNNDSKVLLNSDILNYVGSENLGIDAYNKVDVNLSAKENIIVSNADIQAQSGASVNLDAQSNKLLAGDINAQGFGSGHAIQAASASNVDLNALGGDNNISGVIYAKGDNTVVNLTHEYPQPMSETNIDNRTEGSNIILSSAHGSSDTVGNRADVVAAVYAQSNGEVNIIAGKDGYNYIATDTVLKAGETEQTIWAQQGGKINIEGRTFIIAENSNKNTDKIEGGVDTGKQQAGNSLGIAITAGTGKITDENGNILDEYKDADGSLLDRDEKERSTVKITYEGDENGLNSFVKGDIVSGYGGLINIEKNSTTTGGIDIQGNALAANGGKLNIDLGNGGTWIGRADDYGDAGSEEANGEAHQEFYNPAFSNKIVEGGTVNLKMGNNSTWYVNGQSWITSIDTSGAENATIDLVEANTDRNTTAHALTIYDLKGNANINMSLDGNRNVSDMLYIKNAEGEYNIALADAVTTADMYANGLNGLRFATVGDGSKVKFNAGSYDTGLFNVEYEVGTDEYDGNTENDVYNGRDFNTEKPGTDSVDDFFDYDGADPNEGEVTTLAEVADETALDEVQGTTNYKLIARKGESISDAGNTVLNMSKANYSQAVYMDTLNKRLGEARYLEGDEGLWIRMRHDKIDKDSSYEITNNMYELGYDKKYESKDKNGYHRKGVVIDYMDGDTSYDDIAGSGETNRKGIWLYDTWIGNKGHYTDYVAKWGHLENSFDLYTKTRGEKVSGEYDNDVYSLSAEWGYKDQLNNDWYIEPQVQLQYARVTGADYETSQGTQVSVDGIDSLIARAGFRLGKDFGEEKKSTFYVKADVLHEFLGDQDITAIDKTTDGKLVSIGYDNDGTWYSVGLGFSTMLSDNSYAFLDVEKLFGNDNDNSYQINGGFNWLL